MGGGAVNKEIYKLEAPWIVYAMNWSQRPDKRFRLAISSIIQERTNHLQVVTLRPSHNKEQSNSEPQKNEDFVFGPAAPHAYPANKLIWIPDQLGIHPDLLATSGQFLRLWRVSERTQQPTLQLEFRDQTASSSSAASAGGDYRGPLTSFDWNEKEPSLLGAASVDTTCTLWNVELGKPIGSTPPLPTHTHSHTHTQPVIGGRMRTQLIAHDKEVHDMAFHKVWRELFASVGVDGSIRLYDMRNLQHSNIIFEEPNRIPLMRLAWNHLDPNLLFTFALESRDVLIMDVRMPSIPVFVLQKHSKTVNSASWAPHRHTMLCSVSDDHQALIWELSQMHQQHAHAHAHAHTHTHSTASRDPILSYSAAGQINQVQWSSAQKDWIAITYNNSLEILRM